jgi:hypothetical protein
MSSAPRSTGQRIQDVLHLFENEPDAWVPSANERGEVHLVPLSFLWTGQVFVMALPERSVTARNLQRAGWGRIAIGPTRDVAIVKGPVELTTPPADDPIWDAHAARCGFDARESEDAYTLLTLYPDEIQSWRTPAELTNRRVMRDGRWLANET